MQQASRLALALLAWVLLGNAHAFGNFGGSGEIRPAGARVIWPFVCQAK